MHRDPFSRFKFFRDSQQLSVENLANILNVEPRNILQYEKDVYLHPEMLKALQSRFHFNSYWYLTGEGDMILSLKSFYSYGCMSILEEVDKVKEGTSVRKDANQQPHPIFDFSILKIFASR